MNKRRVIRTWNRNDLLVEPQKNGGDFNDHQDAIDALRTHVVALLARVLIR